MRDDLDTSVTLYVVLAVAGALVGALVVPPAIGALTGPAGTVAVVTLDEPITGGTADQTVRELRQIRENGSIDAVVLRVDSGGGAVTGSEAQFRAVKRLSMNKPVVTSVRTMAASGAYYTVLPSDKIYAEPSSMVGHVGVIASFTGSDGVPAAMTSGPDKATGGTMDQFRAQLETLKKSFVQSVVNERGDVLELSRTEIAQAKIYTGARAVQLGYADEVGGFETAIDSAATAAGLSTYDVVHRNPAESPLATLVLGGTNSSQRVTGTFGSPGIQRVQYLALWGQPSRNATGVITSVDS